MSVPPFRHGLASCPGCQTELVAPIRAAGRTVSCKCCSTRFVLPDADELFEAAVAYLLVETEAREELEIQGITAQIQDETMVRSSAGASTGGGSAAVSNADVSWLG